ncbi:cache domain-containing sensor histidine kinase [Faecalimonas sp.]
MKKTKNKRNIMKKISLSEMLIGIVVVIVLVLTVMFFFTFVNIYKNTTEESVVTSSEQAVLQVKNTVENYTSDMEVLMKMIQRNISQGENDADIYLNNLIGIRQDIVAITTYDKNGKLLKAWSDQRKLKENILENLSFTHNIQKENSKMLNITKPHVESLFVDYYPWVVTISQQMKNEKDETIQVALDIQFSQIANYIDEVGIGQHGYCYIADNKGNIIYHPQQQLIYSGLKEEKYNYLKDGSHVEKDAIYSVQSLDNCEWKIIGVCYIDEMITNKVNHIMKTLFIIFLVVVLFTVIIIRLFSKLFSNPAKELANAMREFEKDTNHFEFKTIEGTAEITSLTESFEHMVIQIKELVEKVRQEEITLRKTELKALQAQINPHFLYNTLDAIAWLCEEERYKDAVEMVNSLAKLFRISISRGHELITIEKEVQHAKSYLKIQNFRYKNQFTYAFDIDEDCLGYLCNKITLQPIIENAIYHGIDRMVDEGKINIGIHQKEDKIIFTIEDNGVGMTLEQCEEILHQDASDRVGIGIKNVNDRIKIYFGDEYGLTIQSELDEGTRVTISMPKITEKDYGEK